jgi:hypothetical protein
MRFDGNLAHRFEEVLTVLAERRSTAAVRVVEV